jgi:Tfp pilus assembly protein PilF
MGKISGKISLKERHRREVASEIDVRHRASIVRDRDYAKATLEAIEALENDPTNTLAHAVALATDALARLRD